MDDQTLISCLSLHLSRFQCRSGQQSILSYIIKNVIMYIVIFSGKKKKMAIIGTFPVLYFEIFTESRGQMFCHSSPSMSTHSVSSWTNI